MRWSTRNKIEEPTSKKTKESPKKANHKKNIKFLKPLLLSWEAYHVCALLWELIWTNFHYVYSRPVLDAFDLCVIHVLWMQEDNSIEVGYVSQFFLGNAQN